MGAFQESFCANSVPSVLCCSLRSAYPVRAMSAFGVAIAKTILPLLALTAFSTITAMDIKSNASDTKAAPCTNIDGSGLSETYDCACVLRLAPPMSYASTLPPSRGHVEVSLCREIAHHLGVNGRETRVKRLARGKNTK